MTHETTKPYLALAKLNGRLYLNCLDGVDDETGRRRPGEGANSMSFIAYHVLDARAWLAGYLGREFTYPHQEALKGVTSIDDLESVPPLADARAAWIEVSKLLEERFAELSEAELTEKSSQQFPVEDETVLGGIAFILMHESFHIGQLAILRKQFGLGPMSYT
jgi:uncharacterized damage-inducible protein DinB